MAASDAMGPWWEAIVHPPTEIPMRLEECVLQQL